MTDEHAGRLDELDEMLETRTGPAGPLPPEVLERQEETEQQTSLELQPAVDVDGMLIHPLTGEALDLVHAPDDLVARFLDDIRTHESLLKEAKAVVTQELLGRLDRAACWTLRAGPYKLTSQSPEPAEEFDGPALRESLLDLVDEGKLEIQAVDAAVETVVTYKPRKAGINALRKLGGAVREAVDRHAQTIEKRRYVSVSRSSQ